MERLRTPSHWVLSPPSSVPARRASLPYSITPRPKLNFLVCETESAGLHLVELRVWPYHTAALFPFFHRIEGLSMVSVDSAGWLKVSGCGLYSLEVVGLFRKDGKSKISEIVNSLCDRARAGVAGLLYQAASLFPFFHGIERLFLFVLLVLDGLRSLGVVCTIWKLWVCSGKPRNQK